MRKSFIFLIALIMCAASVSNAAKRVDTGSTPVALVFSNPVGTDHKQSDSEIVVAIIDQLRASGKMDLLVFTPDLPAVSRAVLEKRIDQAILAQHSDPKKAAQIASAIGAQYAVGIQGSVVDSEVQMILDITRVSDGVHWAVPSTSVIPEVSGPSRVKIRSNAISNAASSAVSQITIQIFGQEAALASLSARNKPVVETPKTAPPAPVITPAPDTKKPDTKPSSVATPTKPAVVRDVDIEYNSYMKQVDDYQAKGNLTGAIMGLKRAINLKPTQSAPRLKLAGIYSDLTMTDEALDECKRAILFNKDDSGAHSMLATLYADNDDLTAAISESEEVIRVDPKNVDVRITLGDLYWNQGKIDEAEKVYSAAADASTGSSVPHERLQKLYIARKNYSSALKHMLEARMIKAGNGLDDAGKYLVLAGIIQDEFNTVVEKQDTSRGEYEKDKLSREDYYKECKDADARIDGLAGFLSTQTAPNAYREAHSHGVLAVNLLFEAVGYTVSYLETEKQHYSELADLQLTEAKTEFGLFTKGIKKS